MKFLRRIRARLPSPSEKAEPPNNVHQHLQAHAQVKSEEYDKARTLLLQAIGSRDDINEPETIRYILTSLAA